MGRISVEEASRRLDMPISAIRGGLRQGSLPIGWAAKNKRWTYYIKEEWVEAYIRGDRMLPEREDQE